MQSALPRISVVIPVYNGQATIAACLQSVLCQDFCDFEVVVIDDGSTDETLLICQQYARKDERIRVFHQENLERSVARWHGVQEARADWVTFVDADDTILPHALSSFYAHISEEVDIILCNAKALSILAEQKIDNKTYRHLVVRGEGYAGMLCGSLYRKSVLKEEIFRFPRDFMMGEDYIGKLRMAFLTEKGARLIKENLYIVERSHTSVSFVWTSSYAKRILDYRLSAVPSTERAAYLEDIITDTIANLFAVSLFEPRRSWAISEFYRQLHSLMRAANVTFSIRQRLFLFLFNRTIRRLLGNF